MKYDFQDLWEIYNFGLSWVSFEKDQSGWLTQGQGLKGDEIDPFLF